MQLKKIIVSFLLSSLIMLQAFAADNLNLFDQPDANSKVVATIKPGQVIVPIFTQGQWIKVGDPSNGNVGWISQDTLQKSGYPTASIQISADSKNLPQQMDTMFTDIEKQQSQMQKQLQQLLQQNLDMLKQMLKN